MVEETIGDILSPPEERIRKAGIDDAILEVVADRKISYPSEIIGDTGISRQAVYDHVRYLAKTGKLERVVMKKFVPDELKERLQELWDMGLMGGAIRRMSWYRVSKEKDGEK